MPFPWRLWTLVPFLWLCVAFFAFVLPATPARMDRTTSDLIPGVPFWDTLVRNGFAGQMSPTNLVLLLAIVGGGAFAIYALALRKAWTMDASPRTVVAIIAVSLGFLLTAAMALPTQNTDVFNYMVQGRVSAVYGENPYLVPANAFPDDPFLPYASEQYASDPNDYLPAWGLYNSVLARFTGDDPVRGLFVYRLTFVLLSLANLGLIVGILARIGPAHIPAGLVTYGWNPIVILESPGRTDTLMAFLALVAAYLVVHRRPIGGTVALTLSVLTKWITLPLLLCLAANRALTGSWKALVAMAGGVLLTSALVYAPFLESAEVLRLHFGMLLRGGSSAPEQLRWAFAGGLVVLSVVLARFDDGDGRPALWTWAALLLYFTAFLTKIGFAWYLIVPTAFIALVRDLRMLVPYLGLSLAAFAFQLRDGSFRPGFEVVDLMPVDRFWVFLALGCIGILSVTFWKSNSTRRAG